MDTRTRSAATHAAALAVALALNGCANSASPPPGAPSGGTPSAVVTATAARIAPPVSPPVAPGFDYGDPSQVGRQFVAAFYSADTTRDAGPADAYARASQYLSGALVGQSAAAAHDGRWAMWASHRARIEVRLTEHPDVHQLPDSTVVVYRAYRITATPVGADGWRGWSEDSFIYCVLHRGDAGWRVAHYDIYPAPPR